MAQPGFRTTSIVVVTTLLDPQQTTKEDLATLYRARWNNELDLRSIKSTMQMRDLRCKTPELVRKEIWTHILAYNLIRTIIAQAAVQHDIEPRSISFKGTVQTLEAFQPVIALQGEGDADSRRILYEQLLDAVACHRVADRPNRYEPRLKKRHPNHYGYLRKPRSEGKRDLLKGDRENHVPFGDEPGARRTRRPRKPGFVIPKTSVAKTDVLRLESNCRSSSIIKGTPLSPL